MANQWCRLWHDMPTDPKWRTIARKSGQPIALVIAVFVHLMVSASANEVSRGVTHCHVEDLSSALDADESDIQAVLDAMQGRVLDGEKMTGWETRQPKREDVGNAGTGAKSAAERKRAQRERERAAREAEQNGNVTNCHAESRDVTTDKDKEVEPISEEANASSSCADVCTSSTSATSADPADPAKPKRKRSPAITFAYDGDKRLHGITVPTLESWGEAYPGIDVRGELLRASAWLAQNPRKKKIGAFVTNWLSRAQADSVRLGGGSNAGNRGAGANDVAEQFARLTGRNKRPAAQDGSGYAGAGAVFDGEFSRV